MGSSILSKAEIDALLHVGKSQTIDQGLIDILTLTTQNLTTRLKQSIDQAVEIDGPYLERVTHSLGQIVSEDSFILTSAVGKSEILLLVSVTDATMLGEELKMEPSAASEFLGQAWLEQLAKNLGVSYSVGSAQQFSLGSLEQITFDNHAYLFRHLIRSAKRGFEFCVLLQPKEIKGLVPAKAGAGQTISLEAQKLIAQGRLLKGSVSPVSEASFSPINIPQQGENAHSITLVEDINLQVTVELGQRALTLNEILELKAQNVIVLDRHAGEAVDVYVNNKRLAKGEVVVLEENFGVRILEIIPKSERLED